jgi:galactonate dehydratase
MRITSLELFKIPPRWLFLKISTDEGISGWGEPVVEGRVDTVHAAVKELSTYLVGQDPERIEDIWQILYRGGFYRGGPVLMSAISGIDQALWDIKGKIHGMPVYQLMGGLVRDRIEVYSWIGGDRPSDVGRAAAEKRAAGYHAVKMNATEEMHYIDSYEKIDAVLERVQTVRDICGGSFGIAVDFHGRVHRAMAKVLAKELEPFKLMFIEEPVLSENVEALRDISSQISTPIALGERLFSRWDFKKIFEAGTVSIIQPDLSHAGGITEVKKIATMAEAYDIALAPHCPLGPISLAAALQIDATTANAFIQEQSLGIHYNAGTDLFDYLEYPAVFEYKDGYMRIPSGPGLGISLDEKVISSAAERNYSWKNPVWRNVDGTIAEW